MTQSEMILYVIKLSLGGLASFFAVMLWSKTKDSSWMAIIASIITSYAGVVYELIVKLGIELPYDLFIKGISLSTLVFTVLPYIFLILAVILKLKKQ